MKSKWKRMKKLDRYLIVDVIGLVLFIISQTIIFCMEGSIPETFCCAVLTCFGIEPICCAYIKTHDKKGVNDGELDSV